MSMETKEGGGGLVFGRWIFLAGTALALVLVALVVAVAVLAVLSKEPQNFVCFHVENEAVEPHFTNVFLGVVEVRRNESRTLLALMRQIAEFNSAFRYKSKTAAEIGEYITEINGRSESQAAELYWLVLREEVNSQGEPSRCYLPTGVSTYIPRRGESIVWVLMRYDKNIPTCDGGSHE